MQIFTICNCLGAVSYAFAINSWLNDFAMSFIQLVFQYARIDVETFLHVSPSLCKQIKFASPVQI